MPRANNIVLTQACLKEYMNYDPKSGLFTWIKSPANRVKVGDNAGFTVKGYLAVSFGGKKQQLHRLAFLYMTGSIPYQVDHIDWDRTNNKWANLRSCTDAENQHNRPMRSTNKSGCTGVSLNKRMNKWQATIGHNRKLIHLGYFNNIADAMIARREAEIKYGYTNG